MPGALDWMLLAVRCDPQVSQVQTRCDCDHIVQHMVVRQALPPCVPLAPAHIRCSDMTAGPVFTS